MPHLKLYYAINVEVEDFDEKKSSNETTTNLTLDCSKKFFIDFT